MGLCQLFPRSTEEMIGLDDPQAESYFLVSSLYILALIHLR